MLRTDVVLVCQQGAQVDAPIKYGTAQAVSELARYFTAAGRRVVLVGLSRERHGTKDGIPFVGVSHDKELQDALLSLSPIGVLIGCSRADIFVGPIAEKFLVYHHGPHPPVGEFAIRLIKQKKIPVVVVSHHSARSQLAFGIPAVQLHVVHNGYHADVFRMNVGEQRFAHRIVFAGHGVFYKGLDIVVAAFARLRQDYPDAECRIFGSTHAWADATGHCWRSDWLDESGRPNWSLIEAELSGLKYCGEVEPMELSAAFRSASILVAPSRINETFGIVSVEAQACGCIPVLPGRGGFPETMRPGITGYTYDSNAPVDLAKTVSDLWAAGLPSDSQRVQAAQWVQSRFSWTRSGAEIAGLIEQSDQSAWRGGGFEIALWKLAISTATKLREVYHEMDSPVLRRVVMGPLLFLRKGVR
jgi:glycosyltransferase involved in cell wall biosynthesis